MNEVLVSKIFNYTSTPTKNVEGQFWFNPSTNVLSRFNGTIWKPITVSSDDVAVLTDGSKVSLTSYLNTQIAALVEGIDSKQDKLLYYSEVSGATPSATISVANIKLEGNVAEGINTTASGAYSHAEGQFTTASEIGSHAEGVASTASGQGSHAEGFETTASGRGSHAEGFRTTASGPYSHAEGSSTAASGRGSHAEGNNTKASSDYQHAQGKWNIEDANDKYADIIGNGTGTSARSNAATVSWDGITWSQTDVRAGGNDQDSATHSLAAKQNATDNTLTTTAKTITGAINELATNKQNTLNYYSETSGDTPSATISVANIKLRGKVAEGSGTTASGRDSHAEGDRTTASGSNSHAEGERTTASGRDSHAEGSLTTASGSNSHAEGRFVNVSGNNSHAEGTGTTASSDHQHAQGKYNIVDANDKYADIIGNGSSTSARSNAATVSWNGISWSQTDVRAGGTDQDSAAHSLAAKQNSTDTALNTTAKTIVGAINEINSIFNVNALPTPITDVKTITTTLENLITDTQYANKPGTILINPAITNTSAILVGENITDLNKAFPIYTGQPVTIAFKNINDFKVAGNVAGDKFNYIVSFGYINTNIVSDNLKITTTNGVYEITPEGDSESMTLKLSKIS